METSRLRLVLASSASARWNGASPQVLLTRSAELLRTFVRNAIRYTKAHSHVEISMRRQEEFPASTALIQIRDYGPGVPDPDLANIFRPFYRVHSSDGSNSNGTGLGLAITERIV